MSINKEQLMKRFDDFIEGLRDWVEVEPEWEDWMNPDERHA